MFEFAIIYLMIVWTLYGFSFLIFLFLLWDSREGKYYCQCDNIDRFYKTEEKGPQGESIYSCKDCGFKHQSWLYTGGRSYVNPKLKKYFYKKSLEAFKYEP